MPDYLPTNAASSGIQLDRKTLKAVAQRSDRPGLLHLARWMSALAVSGGLIWVTLGTGWVWLAMLIHGVLLTVPAYALSHETAHGTAFRSRWLNEAVLWLTSFIYLEEPLHRRYSHTNHHTYTWHVGKDSQMPFDTPMTIAGWLLEVSGIALLRFQLVVLGRLAAAHPSAEMVRFTPSGEMPKMIRNARIMVLLYAGLGALVVTGVMWPLWFLLLPRLLGGPVMLMFTLTQHVELQENSPSILESTRSCHTNWLGRFLYLNMHHHVEHHLYPQVPFHGLPALSVALADRVPQPDPGFCRTNWEVFLVTLRRSLGMSTRAPSIRQAPHMITAGGPTQRIAQRTM